jgi:hypothetical protein
MKKANTEICKYAVSILIVSREFSAANGNDRCFSSLWLKKLCLLGLRKTVSSFSAHRFSSLPLVPLNPLESGGNFESFLESQKI